MISRSITFYLLSRRNSDTDGSKRLKHNRRVEITRLASYNKPNKLVYLGDERVAENIVRRCGLLDPQWMELGQFGNPGNRLSNVPSLVGINHLMEESLVKSPSLEHALCRLWGLNYQDVVGSDHLADEAAPADVVLYVGSHLHFKSAPSLSQSVRAELRTYTKRIIIGTLQ